MSGISAAGLGVCLISLFGVARVLAQETLTLPGSARVEEQKTFQGVPVLIVRPKVILPGAQLVVLFHGFGPPASPASLARALPLERLSSVLAYVNLPLVAGRLPAGGIEGLKRVQEKNFVNGFFFPSINGASTELPLIVHEIAREYHLDVRNGIGLFGFSAGGAAALLALMEPGVPVAAAAILNAPLSVKENVRNWEQALHRQFQWDAAARAAADRYDVERQAGRIANRKPLPALLLMRGGADESFDAEAVGRATAALRTAYEKENAGSKFAAKVFSGVGHNFGPDAKVTTSAPTTASDEIDDTVEHFFERYLMSASN
ncbi:MAG: prolyl oligopeptidase family serine peptidase [Chthoniobacterales bacterium]